MSKYPHCLAVTLLACVVALGACKKKDEGPCTIGDPSTCKNDQVCELVLDAEPDCFDPVVLRGSVFDSSDESGIGEASVVALDPNGQAISDTASTAADGTYSITVPATRDADGNVLSFSVTLRVDAASYVAFPAPPRFALPIDLATGVVMDGEVVVENSVTSVALFSIPDTIPATVYGTIRGTITGTPAPGALVVAEQGAPAVAVSTAIVGIDGSFVLYNVPIGIATSIVAYAAGVHVAPVASMVVAPETVVDVTLAADTTGLATVTGSIMTRNAPNFPATGTSIVLMVESTFLASVGRGLSAPGLRVGNVSGNFSIPNVPPGHYVVLAAFENDGEVRDPDLSLGGNEIPTIEVTTSGGIVNAGAFSVTDALAVVSPGATGLEVVTSITTFSWEDDSGEDGYEFRLFDTFGEVIAVDVDVAKHTGAGPVTFTPALPTLVPGMIYQFRVKSWKNDAMAPGGRTYLSQSEDLLGVFQYAP